MDEFAEIMGYGVGSFLSIYLGLPLGAKYEAAEVWNGVDRKSGEEISYLASAISFYGW